MPPPEDETIAIMVDADKIASLISTARRLLDEEKMVDLSALEGKVANLCRRFGNVPQDSAEPFRAAINGIMTDLDLLAADLARQNEKVRQINLGSDPKQAANAYGKDD